MIDANELREMRAGDRKWDVKLHPLPMADYRLFLAGKLKLKEGGRIIKIPKIEKIGGSEI